MSRKYKMKGYLDEDNRDKKKKSSSKNDTFIKGRVETKYRRTIRCSECSAVVQFIDELKTTDTCKNCRADLHTCRNCKFFDPGAPNECLKKIEERVESKNTRNFCSYFKPKVLVEKAIESKKPSSRDNARKAFEDLFK